MPLSVPLLLSESALKGENSSIKLFLVLIDQLILGLVDLFSGLTLSPDQANTLIKAINIVTNRTSDTQLLSPPKPDLSDYHVPNQDVSGPFYVVTRGLDIGIFCRW